MATKFASVMQRYLWMSAAVCRRSYAVKVPESDDKSAKALVQDDKRAKAINHGDQSAKALVQDDKSTEALSPDDSSAKTPNYKDVSMWDIRYEDPRELSEDSKTQRIVKKMLPMDITLKLIREVDISWKGLKDFTMELYDNAVHYNQRFIAERLKILGPNLAAAHFVVYRGGAVRFTGQTKWHRLDNRRSYVMPNIYVPSITVEAIDLEGMPNILYEGMDNLDNLNHLRWLNLRGCTNVDDWFCDRLGHFRNTLEYLDISGCDKITEEGVIVLHRLRHLKTLKVDNLPNVKHRELVFLLLEDALPQLEIVGFNYTPYLSELSPLEETAVKDVAAKL